MSKAAVREAISAALAEKMRRDEKVFVMGEDVALTGGVIINLSTTAMTDAQALGKMAAEHGVDMLDCPVSGGTRGAADGQLTLMVAGKAEVFEAVRPVMESFASNPVLVGNEMGQGQAVKTINQLLVCVHMCATAEAFTLVKKCGLDLKCVYDVICASAGMSRIFENRGQFVIDRDFSTRSTLQIQLKDTNIVCQTADAAGAPTLLANTARELFTLAVKKYPPPMTLWKCFASMRSCAVPKRPDFPSKHDHRPLRSLKRI